MSPSTKTWGTQETWVTFEQKPSLSQGHHRSLQTDAELMGFKAFRGCASLAPVLTAFLCPCAQTRQLGWGRAGWRGKFHLL